MQYNSLDSYLMAHGMMGRYVLTRNDSCKNQAIKSLRTEGSSDQGRISLIKILDPGRKGLCDYPLLS